MTECKATQPSSNKGTTVGLLTPGSNATTFSRFVLATLSTTYFVSLALKTERMRCNNSSTSGSSSTPAVPIKTASDFITSANGLRPLLFKVPPVETMSQMASLKPKPGPISTDPEMVLTCALTLFS
eukprot:TRINITY_DN12515_c0_g1_i1.p1 TRINITY_DN12515_c0_g1~~TRINITY_DN12515_c0_g1_i1.p1  ORF type:complete len:145 (+),score=4.04 TRINITY_DN12515_c0_g1_i1:59-436(+)